MKIHTDDFRVRPRQKLNLEHVPTDLRGMDQKKSKFDERLQENIAKLQSLQNLLYADNRFALLLIFQAMDAAGKDSTIKKVMSGVNPQGCQVYSFKHPSAEELEHDFLWRTSRCLPERGRIGIFNRSHYEEVLIVRVHPEILAAQNLPKEAAGGKNLWKYRYESIRGLEKHLDRNGTKVVKFFLHVSQDEQRSRFLERIEDPSKNWKFCAADLKERSAWKKYMTAYEECLSATSTKESPWYIVPADEKRKAHVVVSEVIVETLTNLKMSYPRVSEKQRSELKKLRKQLME